MLSTWDRWSRRLRDRMPVLDAQRARGITMPAVTERLGRAVAGCRSPTEERPLPRRQRPPTMAACPVLREHYERRRGSLPAGHTPHLMGATRAWGEPPWTVAGASQPR